MNEFGILGQKALEFGVDYWIDADGSGSKRSPVLLRDLADKVKVLYCFQSWCPGCHSSGFPTLKKLVAHYQNNANVSFNVVQTVFEGRGVNSKDTLLENQKKYDLKIPFGHDDAHPRPKVLTQYRTGGTPWMIIIGRDNTVLYNDYHIELDIAVKIINSALKTTKNKTNLPPYLVQHEQSNHLYKVELAPNQWAQVTYIKHDKVLHLNHSEVPKELRGQGYGAVLMELVLEQIEADGFKVVPVCSYIQQYMQRYKRWAHLLAA